LPSPGKNLQRKKLLAATVSGLKLLINIVLQKCSLQEEVHKRVTLFLRKGKIVSGNAGYKGRISRHRRF